jgi:EAL domain-containing protein (putative c-di-GMP-specific phosphodiesterase class I)
MREERLVLYAQPIVGPDDGGMRTFELLIRMRGEDVSLVLPAEIIPTAERLGLIRDIDRWVARRAIRLLALAQGQNQDVQFSINLSGCAFSDNTLLDLIRDEFETTCASPERLIIEITETTTIANMEGARRFISALQEIGCRFSIDDFGSAASSFYYLKHLPVDFLKIDGSLVTGLAADSSDAHFVHAIVEMCRGLNIRTVAEYVENEKVLDAVSAAGVDFVQGYHLGRPEPLDSYLGHQFAEAAQTLDVLSPSAESTKAKANR